MSKKTPGKHDDAHDDDSHRGRVTYEPDSSKSTGVRSVWHPSGIEPKPCDRGHSESE